MSATTVTPEQAEQAYAYAAAETHTPAFFEKLAAYSISPRTDAEAQQLLQMGAVLSQHEANGHYKTASDAQNEAANPFLSHALGALSVQPAQHRGPDAITKQAMHMVSQSEVAKNAALIFGHVANGGEVASA